MNNLFHTSPRKWFRWALINFLIAGIMGTILRLAFVTELNWIDYRNVLHAHSHVAILGWAYLGFFSLLISNLGKDKINQKKYIILFWLTQVSVIGMFVSFFFLGYHAISICFSTLHIFVAYGFIYYYWKDLKDKQKDIGTRFLKTSVLFFIFSTLALWLMPILMTLEMQNKPIYYISIQYYLHFQFNGWFIFAALGIVFNYLKSIGIEFKPKTINQFYLWLVVSCFLTFALAITWTNPLDVLFYVNSTGVIIQVVALVYFFKIFRESNFSWKSFTNPVTRLLIFVSCVSFALKIIIQTAVVIPYIGTIAYTIRNFVLGYLHLLLLGMVSFFLIAFGIINKWISLDSKRNRLGLIFFIIGFLLTEGFLFTQGLMFWGSHGFIPYYYELIFAATIFLPGGILLMIPWASNKKSSKVYSDKSTAPV